MAPAGDDPLGWLMVWYAGHCDGEWEHGYGVSIQTLDNPGWCLRIDLNGTDLEGRAFEELSHRYWDDEGWWVCRLNGTVFEGFGGATELSQMIRVFRTWVEEPAP
jgi:hypothetical protein